MFKVKSVWSCLTGLFFRTYGTSLAWQCPCDHHQRFWSYKCGFFPLPITLIPGMIDCPLKIQELSVKKFLSWCWPLSVYGFELDLFAFEDEVTFINFKITGYFTSREEHGETDSHISWSWWWCQLLCLLLFPFGHLLLGQNSSPVLPKWLYWIAALSTEVSHLCCSLLLFLPFRTYFGFVFNRWYHCPVEHSKRADAGSAGAARGEPCEGLPVFPRLHLFGVRDSWRNCCFVECAVIQVT